jgi:hypothetical protein
MITLLLAGSFESHVSIFEALGVSGATGVRALDFMAGGIVQPVGPEVLAALPPAVQAELLSLRQAAVAAAANANAAAAGPLLRMDELERRVARLATTHPEAAAALEAGRSRSSPTGGDGSMEAAAAESAALRSEVRVLLANCRFGPGLLCDCSLSPSLC